MAKGTTQAMVRHRPIGATMHGGVGHTLTIGKLTWPGPRRA